MSNFDYEEVFVRVVETHDEDMEEGAEPDTTVESPDDSTKMNDQDFSPPPDANLFEPSCDEPCSLKKEEAETEAEFEANPDLENTTNTDATMTETPTATEESGTFTQETTVTPEAFIQETNIEETTTTENLNENDTESEAPDMVDMILEGKRCLTRKITRSTSNNPSVAHESRSISPEQINDSEQMDKIHDLAEMA